MTRLFFLLVCAFSLATQAATAADIPLKAPGPVPYYTPAHGWTGFYIGLQGGYGWGQSHHTSSGAGIPQTPDFDVDGALLGGTLGYNWQAGSIVYGIEGDISWSDMDGTITSASTAGCGNVCNTELSWLGTVRGRVGVVWNRMLPYITGGIAFGRVEAGDTGGAVSDSSTELGWTLGGGIETAFAPRWTVKLEYLYVDLGSSAVTYGALPAWNPTDASFSANIVRAGVNYRF